MYKREADKLQQFERDVINTFDKSFFVSAQEAELSRQLAPEASASISYIDNGVDHEYFIPDPKYKNPFSGNNSVVVFTGAMDYWANVDAGNCDC